MADSNDDAPPDSSRLPLGLPQGLPASLPVRATTTSPVDDLFNRVNSWSAETLGAGNAGGANEPFARQTEQPLSSWAMLELGATEPGATRPAAVAGSTKKEPAGSNPADLYAAHERSYDSAGRDNPFVDPSAFALAVHGAPLLEPANASPGSSGKAGANPEKLASSAAAASASLTAGTGDSILNSSAALYADAQSPPSKAAAIWKKLWRY